MVDLLLFVYCGLFVCGLGLFGWLGCVAGYVLLVVLFDLCFGLCCFLFVCFWFCSLFCWFCLVLLILFGLGVWVGRVGCLLFWLVLAVFVWGGYLVVVWVCFRIDWF